MNQKMENDAEAFLRSYVTKRNRNTDAAIAAVQSSHSYTAEEALNQHLIDLIANSDAGLLTHSTGAQITRMDGSKLTLHVAGARVRLIKPTLREEVLEWLVDPNIALLFLVGGALLIYLEFNAPGTIVPGALGTLDGAAGGFCASICCPFATPPFCCWWRRWFCFCWRQSLAGMARWRLRELCA